MIIIYGTHHYGKVDSHDHQYQLTRFFHLYYIPLLPLSSIRVTGVDADGYIGHETPFSIRSVFAGYARVWGDGRTPQDVARLGANTPDEAILAYAQLRLAARAGKGKVRRHARAAAELVLTNFRATSPTFADPYRAAAPLREPGPSE